MAPASSAVTCPATDAGLAEAGRRGARFGGADPDDQLVSIPVDDSSLGSFQSTFYNAVQDCVYYVEWTLTKD